MPVLRNRPEVVVEWGQHSLGEAGRRAGDEQTSLQTLIRSRLLAGAIK